MSKKAYRVFKDIESSGLKDKYHQIYTLGMIVKDDYTGEEVERLVLKILPKHNRWPNPYAIKTNKLRPWSEEYQKGAMTENEAVNYLVHRMNHYTVANEAGLVKPIFTSYNVAFDSFHLGVALSRAGHTFGDTYNKVKTDPMIMARNQIKAGNLKTSEKNKSGKSSAKLEHVVAALGSPFKKGEAHTVMSDTEKAVVAYEGLVEMGTGKSPYGQTIAYDLLPEGEVIHIGTNSKGSGLKFRHVYVVKNDPNLQKIYAVDLDDFRKNGNAFKDSTVRTFNYLTITEEKRPLEEDSELIKKVYREFRAECDEIVKNKFEQDYEREEKFGSTFNEKDIFDPDVKDFALIEGVEGILSNGEMSRDEILETLIERNINPASLSAIMTKAHELNLAKGGKGLVDEPHLSEDTERLSAMKAEFEKIASEMNLDDINEGDLAVADYLDVLREECPGEFEGEAYDKIMKGREIGLPADKYEPMELPFEKEEPAKEIVKKSKKEATPLFTHCRYCGRELKSQRAMKDGIGRECLKQVKELLTATPQDTIDEAA